VDLCSAFIVVPHTQGAQVRITQCYLQITPYLPLPYWLRHWLLFVDASDELADKIMQLISNVSVFSILSPLRKFWMVAKTSQINRRDMLIWGPPCTLINIRFTWSHKDHQIEAFSCSVKFVNNKQIKSNELSSSSSAPYRPQFVKKQIKWNRGPPSERLMQGLCDKDSGDGRSRGGILRAALYSGWHFSSETKEVGLVWNLAVA